MKKNTIYHMRDLLPEIRRLVKKRRDGIFHNAFIIHRRKAYGYTAEGIAFLLDAADVPRCSPYRWEIHDGYVVSYEIQPGECLEMGAFILRGGRHE